ncbi:uncharacterized protein [Epargyreus clarus]|uniref:uncharacterized protein n=1 Tax=Epargyreus clarus TaxID=520877 RepID=UPI003C2D5D80
MLVLATTQDLLGVNYSFDVDFYRNFDSKKCENESVWRLERYEALEIDPPFADSDKGLQAVGKSCASSFPIIFFGGTLEFHVYVRVFSQRHRISIEVLDENDAPITRFAYGLSSEGYAPGWRILSLKIDKCAKGYIRLRGRSLSNETVVVDSFRYTPNSTAHYDYKQNITSLNHEIEDEDIIFTYKDLNIEEEDVIGNSDLIDEELGSGETPPDPVDPEVSSVWTPLTIFLTSFGVVVVVAVVAVSAYHCGSIRARDNAFPAYDDVPPSTITIPRVGTPDSRSDFARFY